MKEKKTDTQLWQTIAANVSRLLLAATFLFSGFVKANDPFGTAYKLEDYAHAFGFTDMPQLTLLIAAILLAVFEFTLGIHTLAGMSHRIASRIVALFMGAMTLLTVYIYIFDPVSDCGCFGDVIVLSNGATLAKNIVLMAAAVLNLKFNDRYIKLMGANTQWLTTMFSTVYILWFAISCMRTLPMFDFRPYKIGTNLREAMEAGVDFETKIIYQREGETLELLVEDDDPDSTWTYVETRTTPKGNVSDLPNLYAAEMHSGDDVTDDIIYDEGYTFLLIIPDLMNADEGCIDLINEIYEYSQHNNYDFYCLTASADSTAQLYWSEHTGAEYPYYLSDERELKTIIRSTPGLLLLKDGVIINKWSSTELPDEYILTGALDTLDIGTLNAEDNNSKLLKVFLYFILPLLIVFLIDRIGSGFSFYRDLKRKSKKLQMESIIQNKL